MVAVLTHYVYCGTERGFGLKIYRQSCTILKMKIRTMLLILLPVLLFACTALKPVEGLTDKELIDRYYKVDLDLYMVKRASGGMGDDHISKDAEKIKKIENKLAIMKQELNTRGYMP